MVIEKYRGRSPYQKQWVYGYLFRTPLIAASTGNIHHEGCGFLTGIERMCISQNNAAWEVNPLTIGMCSGFQDTNKQDIYTDDVIQLNRPDQDPMLFICRFGDIEFTLGDADINARGFYFELVKNGMKCYIQDIANSDIKIIGNSIDNPELVTKLILP